MTLRVQVPNNHILTQNLYYNYYYPKPKYLIIGYMDPLGEDSQLSGRFCMEFVPGFGKLRDRDFCKGCHLNDNSGNTTHKHRPATIPHLVVLKEGVRE